MGKKPRCPKCDKKISRKDRLQRGIVARTATRINPQFKQEFEERKTWCMKCLQQFFLSRYSEQRKTIPDESIPTLLKPVLKRADKEAEERVEKR